MLPLPDQEPSRSPYPFEGTINGKDSILALTKFYMYTKIT